MKNQLKIGVLLSYFNIFLGLIISIVYTPFMLKSLGDNQYGLYTLVSSIIGYLGLLNFGFSSSYIRYYSKFSTKLERKSIEKLNGMFLTVFIFIGVVVLFVGISLLPFLGGILGDKIVNNDLVIAKSLFLIMVINLSVPLFTTVFNVYVIAHEQFIFLKMISLLKTILNPLMMIPVLMYGFQSIGMALVTLLLTLFFELLIVAYSIKKMKIRFYFREFDFSMITEMVVFSSYIFLNMIIDQVNWSVDKFLLGRYKGTTAVAIYGIASQINSYYLMFSTQISGVFTPKINKIIAEGNSNDQLNEMFKKIGRIQFIILGLILLGFYTFGSQFIILWAGENYESAYYVVLLLIGSVTIPLIQNTGIEIQRAKNMHKFRSIVYFFIAIGNVLISINLVQRFGPIGAAAGTAIALIIGNGLIMNWYYHKFVGLDMVYFWKSIGRLSIGMIIPLLAAIFIKEYISFSSIFVYIASIVLFVVIYSLSVWGLGMDRDEKNLVLIPLCKVLKKAKIGGLLYDKN